MEQHEQGKDAHGNDVDYLPPGWTVYLPHQCDDWAISAAYTRVPHADAVTALEEFIAEGEEALAALRAGHAYPPASAK